MAYAPHNIICGIYEIRQLSTNRVYIGSSRHIYKRWVWHRMQLRRGLHTNQYLQRAWSKYGENDFRFTVIENVGNPDLLSNHEQSWFTRSKCCQRTHGFNIQPNANNSAGRPTTDETRQRLSIAGRGRKHSEQSRRMRSLAMKGNKRGKGRRNAAKLNEKDVYSILVESANGKNHNEIADQYKVTPTTIARIINRKTWAHVVISDEIDSRLPKGRMGSQKGENGNASKITNEQAREIKARRRNGETCKSIAVSLGITVGIVEAISSDRTWKHIN